MARIWYESESKTGGGGGGYAYDDENDENDEDINTLYCEFKLPTLVGRTVPGFKRDFEQTSRHSLQEWERKSLF